MNTYTKNVVKAYHSAQLLLDIASDGDNKNKLTSLMGIDFLEDLRHFVDSLESHGIRQFEQIN